MNLVTSGMMASAAAASLIGPSKSPTKSWWLENLPASAVPPAQQSPPESCEVVIIGAGMTGCSTAYFLQKLFCKGGEDVVVLDARGCAGGATGRNGGHLWPNPTSDFENDTVSELINFIESEQVDCDLTHGGAAGFNRRNEEVDVEYHDTPDDPETAAAEEEWGEDFEEWDASTCAARMQTDAFTSAASFPAARQLFPAKVTAALLKSARCTFCAPIRVLSIEEEDGGNWQQLRWSGDADGEEGVSPATGVLRARRVVVATNGWAAELLPELAANLYATRNTVVMTAPLPATSRWGVGGFSVDSDIGARELYAIRRPDGRVCLGGARALEPSAAVGSSDDATTSDVVGAYLRRFLRDCFPELLLARGNAPTADAEAVRADAVDAEAVDAEAVDAEAALPIEAEWSGVLGFTSDGKPIVGPLPGRPNVFVAAGFCGHGMPQCFGVGKGIALMLNGGEAGAGDVHPFLRSQADPARFS